MSSASETNNGTQRRSLFYRAQTLVPTEDTCTHPLVMRHRVHDAIDRQTHPGTVSLLVGPIGSGKSTAAMQWIRSHREPVHYISARPFDDLPESWINPPGELGLAIAEFASHCATTTREPSADSIGASLQRVVQLATATRERFVLDDIEMFSQDAMSIVLPLLMEYLPQMESGRALLISRSLDTGSLAGLKLLPSFRVHGASMLAFDAEETARAHEAGVFGSAPIDDVLQARADANGWILGMLAALGNRGGRTIDAHAFQMHILNSLLMAQPAPMLHLVVASAYLPVLSVELWEHLFDQLDSPQWAGPPTMAQLPTSVVSHDAGTVVLVAPIRKALRRLREITTQKEDITGMLVHALNWYVSNGDLESASTIAAEHGLHEPLLARLKPVCRKHAEVENWSEIRVLLGAIPETVLLRDPELVIWYFLGLLEVDRWAETRRLFDRVAREWETSDDPATRGRFFMVQGWHDHLMGRIALSIEHSVAGYNILPEGLHRERLWTAGSISIASSLVGNMPEARRWSATANYEATYLTEPSRWWHNNPGVIRLGWLATGGMLDEAYELASQQVRSLRPSGDPSNAVRYLLLQAQIDIERLRFESATTLIAEAESLSDGQNSQPHFIRITRAGLARAKGDLDSAWDELTRTTATSAMRFDQFQRETASRARLAIEMRDHAAAELLIDSSPPMEDNWPRHFSDPHPDLVRAQIHAHGGDHSQAVAMCQNVLQQARARHYTYWIVRALVHLAYLHDRAGEFAQRNTAIDLAEQAAGQSGFQIAFHMFDQDVRTLRTAFAPLALDATRDQARQLQPHDERNEHLTTREIEVLNMLALDRSNKEIAEALYLSVSTVKNHLRNAYHKLGADNRQTAVRRARERGIIRDQPNR